MIYLLDLFGTMVFAISGALVAREKRMDLFGVSVIAVVTAVGGGTLRDLILGVDTVFWVADTTYIILAVIISFITVAVVRYVRLPRGILPVADAFGLAMFSVIGAQVALGEGVSALVAVIMGVMTGVVGGMIRDLLSDEIPLILRSEIYATAALGGASVYVLLYHTEFVSSEAAMIPAVLVTLSLRLAALRWGWTLPSFQPVEHEKI